MFLAQLYSVNIVLTKNNTVSNINKKKIDFFIFMNSVFIFKRHVTLL